MIVSNDPESTVSRVISTVSRVISTVSRVLSTVGRVNSTNGLPRWKKNLLRSYHEHDIIYSDHEDQTDPEVRRSLSRDQERTMYFNVFYKIEVFQCPDKSIDVFMYKRYPDEDTWSLIAGRLDCGHKGLIVNYLKRISFAVGNDPSCLLSFLCLNSVAFLDCLSDFEHKDFVEADLIAVITFDGHCDTQIALKTYAEHLHDGGVGYLFG